MKLFFNPLTGQLELTVLSTTTPAESLNFAGGTLSTNYTGKNLDGGVMNSFYGGIANLDCGSI